jgi:uncharacterized OB-fold protein
MRLPMPARLHDRRKYMAELNSPPEPRGDASKGAAATKPTEAAPVEVWRRSESGVVLIGWACRRCGKRGIPRQKFGCEACGAPGDEIDESTFPALGVLRSSASVERHAVWPVPFMLGEIELDSGPIIHSFLSADTTWKPGVRVAGDPTDESRQPYVTFRLDPHGAY